MISRSRTTADKGWTLRLKAAKSSRERQTPFWYRNRRLLFPNFRNAGKRPVKVAWASYQTMIGVIFAQTPSPIVREKRPELQNTARQLTQYSSQKFAEMNTRYVTRMCAQDVFWAGLGIAMMRLDQGLDGDKPKNQNFSMERVHPEGMLFDPQAVDPNLTDHRWVAREFYPTITQLKNDPAYKISREALEKLPRLHGAPFASSRIKPTDPAGEGDEEQDDDFAQVRMQEVYDRENERLIYLASDEDGGALVTGEADWPVEPRFCGTLLFPFNVMYFNENSDDFWPIPEMTMIADEIEQLSVLDKQMLQDAVTKFRVFLAKVSLLQKGHVEMLKEGGSKTRIVGIDGNAVVGGNLEGLRLDDVLRAVEEPSVKQDIAGVAALKKQQIHETIGAGDFASAGFRSTRSATEAAALSDFLRSRMNTRTENIDAFFKRQTRLLILFIQETATEEQLVRYTDEHGIQQWEKIVGSDIKKNEGGFDFDVIAGSSMPKNTDSVRERNIAFFQQAAPLVVQQGGDLWPLIEWIAPFYDIPQHFVDQLHSGHRNALQLVAKALAARQAGAPVPGDAFIELVSRAVMTGLSTADLAAIAQAVQAATKGGVPVSPGAAASVKATGRKRQPKGLPGTNTSPQTL